MTKIDRQDMGRLPANPKKMNKVPKGAMLNQLVCTARRARTALSARLAELGLHAGQEQILLALSEEERLPLSSIADMLGVRAQTITRAIARLEAQGLVFRTPSQEDGRVNFIALAPAGREIVGDLKKAVKKVERQMLRPLDKVQRKTLLRFLETLDNELASDNAKRSGE
ncbi:MarR family winged helix-turn-helix transcriptional regulator [Notoacmeibacter sp. MSK16QG-6]|uniref:MarR family winged helix-turn-helix transcriptional regulator n=1 Tax=Notoacmeibacter sp. MSK16QG-6 TaxID=2957982 RepID=UPI0020A135ED|nr:MarR family transcriptional regulator [Notoacmeibacter sp. MSK16QG-6]MCP1200321.1 MarR family transcriptional regulator [Notoacmeibacter sp. MSK16QG-6]